MMTIDKLSIKNTKAKNLFMCAFFEEDIIRQNRLNRPSTEVDSTDFCLGKLV